MVRVVSIWMELQKLTAKNPLAAVRVLHFHFLRTHLVVLVEVLKP